MSKQLSYYNLEVAARKIHGPCSKEGQFLPRNTIPLKVLTQSQYTYILHSLVSTRRLEMMTSSIRFTRKLKTLIIYITN